jgi:hypothetical protein
MLVDAVDTSTLVGLRAMLMSAGGIVSAPRTTPGGVKKFKVTTTTWLTQNVLAADHDITDAARERA